jgi:hypothetical protein
MSADRAVSTALGYVLTLGITAILVSGLLIAGGTLVEDQRDKVIENELQVVGEQLVTHINAADRLNQSGHGNTNVTIEQPFPSSVAGESYRITLEERADPRLHLESSQSSIAVTIPVINTTAMGQSTASGGTVVIEYDPGRDAVVVDDA